MINFLTSCINNCTSPICRFDKTATLPTILFELFILASTVIFIVVFSKIQKKFWQKYIFILIGVNIFEIFTTPMWQSPKMGWWAYIYGDVSWILTLAWTTFIALVVFTIDILFEKSKQWQRFLLYLVIITPVVLFFEALVIEMGIRYYSPEVQAAVSKVKIPFLNLPLDALYYIPVFISLIIGFYKFWDFSLGKKPLVPIKRQHWLRNLLITFLTVFMYEIMVEPMAVNANFPKWSYIFHDITIVMTGFWVVSISLATLLIEKFFIHFDLKLRFAIILILLTILTAPVEAWLINYGYRIYSPSTVANFSGIKSLIFRVPIEVIFAVPFYLALVIAFMRFWEIVFDNKL